MMERLALGVRPPLRNISENGALPPSDWPAS